MARRDLPFWSSMGAAEQGLDTFKMSSPVNKKKPNVKIGAAISDSVKKKRELFLQALLFFFFSFPEEGQACIKDNFISKKKVKQKPSQLKNDSKNSTGTSEHGRPAHRETHRHGSVHGPGQVSRDATGQYQDQLSRRQGRSLACHKQKNQRQGKGFNVSTLSYALPYLERKYQTFSSTPSKTQTFDNAESSTTSGL